MVNLVQHILSASTLSQGEIARDKASANELSDLCEKMRSKNAPGECFSFPDIGKLYIAIVRYAPHGMHIQDSETEQEQRPKKIALQEYTRVVFTRVYLDRTILRLSPAAIFEKERVQLERKKPSQSTSLTSLLACSGFEEDASFFEAVGRAVVRGAKNYSDGVRRKKDNFGREISFKYHLEREYDAIYRRMRNVIERRGTHE